MNSLQQLVAIFGDVLQRQLFPALEQELGFLGERMQEFIRALALVGLDGYVAVRHGRGRRPHDRSCIARAFLAKAIFNLPHTRALLERLAYDEVLRRLCGWDAAADVPDETVFSRAFAEFARTELPQRVQEALVQRTRAQRLVGHILRDSTAILVPEKPAEKKAAKPSRRSHRQAGTTKKPEQMSPTERQWLGKMTLAEMLAELPRVCDKGCKPNAHGRRELWVGYKLHLDVADGEIPISYVLTSASVNDMQVAIPLARMSAQRVQSCYEVMDTGFDCTAIREHGRELQHVPIIPYQKRGSQKPPELAPHEQIRYRERSAVERVFSRLKDQYGAANVRVRGAAKVMAHLMFGILALTADQILRWAGLRDAAGRDAPA